MESYSDSFGDLGLGRGLKPGSVWRNYDSDVECPDMGENPKSKSSQQSFRSSSLGGDGDVRRDAVEEGVISKLTSRFKPSRISASITDKCALPKLKESNYKTQQHDESTPNSSVSNFCSSVVQKKLQLTQQELEELKQEQNLFQLQLSAKDKATRILQQQLALANREREILSTKSENLNKSLIQELNKVQFELKCYEGKFLESQENWSAKFDSISHENLQLTSALEEQTLKQRQMFAEKMALSRERDELIALIHIRDQNKLESLQPSSSHNSYPFNTFTTSELALLGACHCCSDSCTPCACAMSAICLKKEIVQNREEVDQLKQERDDALALADIYRIAFDDQLSRNRSLVKQLSKALKEVNDGDCCSSLHSNNSESFPASMETSNGYSLDELVKHLEETVIDKSEALAHQKFAARLLAIRVRQLEEKLSKTSEDKVAGQTELEETVDTTT